MDTQQTHNTYRTHTTGQWFLRQIPPSTSLALPRSWDTSGRASNLYHTFAHTTHTAHSLPKPLSCRDQHRVASTFQQHSAVFPSHWHRESLERHWKELVSSCGWNMGRRNEADVFSFGSGLDLILQPRSCRISPVSVLIHLDNGGLVLRA